MRCAHCNAEIISGDAFCGKCGAGLNTNSANLMDRSESQVPLSSTAKAIQHTWRYVLGGALAAAVLGAGGIAGYRFFFAHQPEAGSQSPVANQTRQANQPPASGIASGPNSEEQKPAASSPRELSSEEQKSALNVPAKTAPKVRSLTGNNSVESQPNRAPEQVEVDSRPVLLNAPRPLYTEEARNNKVQGVVRVRVLVDEKGSVTEVVITRGLPDGLNEQAIRAAHQMRFRPATKNGQPVSYWLSNVEIEFRLR
jgi:TonB family protein